MKSNEKIGGKILQCHVVDTDRVIRHRTRCIIELHGIGVKNYNDVRVGDMIEVFEIIEIQRSID